MAAAWLAKYGDKVALWRTQVKKATRYFREKIVSAVYASTKQWRLRSWTEQWQAPLCSYIKKGHLDKCLAVQSVNDANGRWDQIDMGQAVKEIATATLHGTIRDAVPMLAQDVIIIIVDVLWDTSTPPTPPLGYFELWGTPPQWYPPPPLVAKVRVVSAPTAGSNESQATSEDADSEHVRQKQQELNVSPQELKDVGTVAS